MFPGCSVIYPVFTDVTVVLIFSSDSQKESKLIYFPKYWTDWALHGTQDIMFWLTEWQGILYVSKKKIWNQVSAVHGKKNKVFPLLENFVAKLFLTESYEMLFSLIYILYIIILSNCTIQTFKLYTRLVADTMMISFYVTNTLYPDNRPAQ